MEGLIIRFQNTREIHQPVDDTLVRNPRDRRKGNDNRDDAKRIPERWQRKSSPHQIIKICNIRITMKCYLKNTSKIASNKKKYYDEIIK